MYDSQSQYTALILWGESNNGPNRSRYWRVVVGENALELRDDPDVARPL